jgi:hypothetical protein
MSKFGVSLAALVLGLLTGASPQAAPRSQNHGHRDYHARNDHRRENRREFYRDYFRDHGHRFKYGWYYEGRHHRHWIWSYYNRLWRTTFYFDRALGGYYYWSQNDNRFYPLSYIDEAPPTNDLGPISYEEE